MHSTTLARSLTKPAQASDRSIFVNYCRWYRFVGPHGTLVVLGGFDSAPKFRRKSLSPFGITKDVKSNDRNLWI
ncbi:hypothetical protein [Nonomuraea cavernae]|uniref:hypothetical protein n=1 Tax=Nonomuraea cavernae TaxID=2045107 RepID=UPI003402EE4E